MEGYIELNPDWNENLDAAMAAAAAEVAVEVGMADGGGPGVAGDPSEVISFPLWPSLPPRAPFPPPTLLLFCSDGAELPVVVADSAADGAGKSAAPLAPLAVLCELPLSRFWLRSFSSRRHFALRFENQT